MIALALLALVIAGEIIGLRALFGWISIPLERAGSLSLAATTGELSLEKTCGSLNH